MFNSVYEGVLVGLVVIGVVGTIGLLLSSNREGSIEPDDDHNDDAPNIKEIKKRERD